jgi:hypothetical protein
MTTTHAAIIHDMLKRIELPGELVVKRSRMNAAHRGYEVLASLKSVFIRRLFSGT